MKTTSHILLLLIYLYIFLPSITFIIALLRVSILPHIFLPQPYCPVQ